MHIRGGLMKKTILTLCLCMAILAFFTGCGYYKNLPHATISGVPAPFPGVATLDEISEEDMAAYPDAPRFVRYEEAFWMAFRFEEPVSNVVFVSLGEIGFNDTTGNLTWGLGPVLYEAGDLAAGQPFFLKTYGHIGTMPAQAIGFTYTDGVRYYIPFDEDMMYGGLTLWKESAFTFGNIQEAASTTEQPRQWAIEELGGGVAPPPFALAITAGSMFAAYSLLNHCIMQG
jgi:hypothetical protein